MEVTGRSHHQCYTELPKKQAYNPVAESSAMDADMVDRSVVRWPTKNKE